MSALLQRPRWRMIGVASLAVVVAAGLVATLEAGRSTATAGSSLPPGVVFQRSGPGKGMPELAAGVAAPGFALPRLGGGAPVKLSAYRGDPVVLNFFASWCSDCRAELKAFGQVSRGRHGDVRFLGIDTNDPAPATARALLAKAGIRYPVGVDPHATVANARYYIEGLPVTVFIDASGRIVGQAYGAQTESSLRRWVDELQRSASPGKAATS